MMMKTNLKMMGLIASVVLASCQPDAVVERVEQYDNGFFVSCEGNFMAGNGSISFVAEDGTVENGVFQAVNALPLGDVVQSMTIIDTLAYIAINGSAKVEVVDAGTMESIASITELSSPRFITQVSEEKAYITDWSGEVAVLDLLGNTITTKITVGIGPEALVVSGNYVFVTNKGGWGLDSTVSVIDIATDAVVETIVVGEKPAYIQVDVNGDVWVLSEGNTVYNSDWTEVTSETAGRLTKINANSLIVESVFNFDSGEHPMSLVINETKDVLYYKKGAWGTSVFAHSIYDMELADKPFIAKSFYSLGAHEGMVYGTDAMDFSQAGWVFQYTAAGILVDSLQVGIIPGGFAFR